MHTPPALAYEPDILETLATDIEKCGVAGEKNNVKIVCLTVISRLLDQPVSSALKGLSSSGKNKIVVETLKFFPPSAYIEMTATPRRSKNGVGMKRFARGRKRFAKSARTRTHRGRDICASTPTALRFSKRTTRQAGRRPRSRIDRGPTREAPRRLWRSTNSPSN